MMKRTVLAACAVAAVGLFGPAPADAQEFPEYRFDLGVFGGGSWYSAMLDDEHLGEDSDDVRYKAGWVTGLQATFWVTPTIGIRAHGAFSERPITGGDDTGIRDEDENLLDDVNLWSASGDLMFRLGGPRMLGGWENRPYLALGIGGKNTNPPGDINIGNPDDEDETGTIFYPNANLQVYQVSQFTLMGLAALGTDMRLSDNFGLRLEVGDRFWDATLRQVGTDSDEDFGKVTHEVYGQLGAHMLLGLVAPEVVAVAPAPPAPAPPPAPPAPPAPVEERITVCVIDPAAPGGIRDVDAIYLPEQGDTMVVVNGARQPISATLPNVMLANEADWFVRGEPLQLTIAPDLTLEYTTWQSGRMIESDELAYLGTVRGVPVYASANEVEDVREELEEARRSGMTNDLDDILEQRRDLREDIEDIQYLYVPLRPTGCVFQTVQQVEQVRKKDS